MKTLALGQIVLLLLCVVSSSGQNKEQGESEKEKDAKWIQLFNRKDLSGWNVLSATRDGKAKLTEETIQRILGSWKVKDGVLVASGTAGSIKYERGQFADFHLRLEASASALHVSSVTVRVPDPDSYNLAGYPAGYDVVVGGWPKKESAAGNFTGDLNKLPQRVKEMLVKPDDWFTLEVIARGDRFLVKVNGKTTLDFTDPKKELFTGDPEKAVKKGYIALSIRGTPGETRFRKIEIRELSGHSSAPDKK